MKLYDDLVWRGLVKYVSNPELEEVLNNVKVTFYWGTDPTADSLHISTEVHRRPPSASLPAISSTL